MQTRQMNYTYHQIDQDLQILLSQHSNMYELNQTLVYCLRLWDHFQSFTQIQIMSLQIVHSRHIGHC